MDDILRKRLYNEHAMMSELASLSPLVSFESSGDPATKYSVTLTCGGLCQSQDDPDHVLSTQHHEFDILLNEGFPYWGPEITWKTPIFHPNFLVPAVCLGDHWFPASTLRDVTIALCELIQYKKFNIYSALHRDAGGWLMRVLKDGSIRIPVDDRAIIAASAPPPATSDPSATGDERAETDFALTPRRIVADTATEPTPAIADPPPQPGTEG